MNSAELRQMLKPMADFAPAILRCGEILDATAEAEKRLLEIPKELEAKQAQIKEIDQRVATAGQLVQKARNTHAAEVEKIKAEEAKLRESLQPLREQKAKLMAEIEAAQRQADAEKKKLSAELADLAKRRDGMLAEIAALQKKFAA